MISLYLDEDSLRHSLARGLRSNGIDVVTTLEAGRLSAGDEDQLLYAISQGRTIYTANVAHFQQLHTEWMQQEDTIQASSCCPISGPQSERKSEHLRGW